MGIRETCEFSYGFVRVCVYAILCVDSKLADKFCILGVSQPTALQVVLYGRRPRL
jgi:hypothetical protein